MPFKGKIALKKPDCEVGVFEDWAFDWMGDLARQRDKAEVEVEAVLGGSKGKEVQKALVEELQKEGKMRAVWMGRKVRSVSSISSCVSRGLTPPFPTHPRSSAAPPPSHRYLSPQICDTQRHLIDVYDLKKRAYIGTTSMESEASLLMANQALAAPGKWMYDPFVGTGSMLYTAAGFGALTFGSDIDGRQIRGKSALSFSSPFPFLPVLTQRRPADKSISHSAKQYGVGPRIVDCCSFDMTQHPWRTGELFDAIVTDRTRFSLSYFLSPAHGPSFHSSLRRSCGREEAWSTRRRQGGAADGRSGTRG